MSFVLRIYHALYVSTFPPSPIMVQGLSLLGYLGLSQDPGSIPARVIHITNKTYYPYSALGPGNCWGTPLHRIQEIWSNPEVSLHVTYPVQLYTESISRDPALAALFAELSSWDWLVIEGYWSSKICSTLLVLTAHGIGFNQSASCISELFGRD